MAETRFRITPRRAAVLAAQAVLAVAIVWAIWRSLAAGSAHSGFAALRFDPGWLAAAVAVMVASSLYSVGGLHLLLRALGERPAFRDVFKIAYASNLGKYLPGAFWPVAGKVAMAQRARIRRRTALVASLVEMAVSVAGGALVLTAALASGMSVGAALPVWAPLLLAAGIVACLHPAILTRVLRLGMRLMKLEGEPPRVPFARTLGLTLYFCGAWVLGGVALRLFTLSLVPQPGADWVDYVGFNTAAHVGGFLVVFAPGGLGVREGILLAALTPVLGAPSAAVISVAVRVVLTLQELALSATALALPWRTPAAEPDS